MNDPKDLGVATTNNGVDNPERTPSRGMPGKNRGWRTGVSSAAVGTAIVFLLNLSTTIWALSTHDLVYGSASLYEGSCTTTKQLNTGIHFLINVFSSVILSSSNYTMQCLSSPTRIEIDEAHGKGEWLDIGVPSVRNLSYISKKKKFLWFLIGLSSIPLHLFYNSAVFTTIAANDYSVVLVNHAWLSSDVPYGLDEYAYEREIRIWRAYKSGKMDRLEPLECIATYARPFVSSNSHVLLVPVANGSSADETPQILDRAGGGDIHITGAMTSTNLDPYPWICSLDYNFEGDFCNVDSLGIGDDSFQWKLGNRTIDYCLSEVVEEHCKVRLNAVIAALVLVINLVKSVLIMFVAFRIKDDPLMNMGDAVASFLQRPDLATEGSCLLSKESITKKKDGYSNPWGPRVFHDERKRWFAAASRRRLLAVFLASFLGLTICTVFLIYGLYKMPGASPSDIWSLGFGEATEHTLITFSGIRRRMIRTSGTLSNVLIANAGQTILSFLYFTCNGLLTIMLLSHEWSSYAFAHKGLRVSSYPRGHQRITYFLQLPFRYAIPLVLSGTVLHWLGSQSIFLVTVEQWSNDFDTGEWVHDDFHDFATCAYSPMALFIFVVTAAILLFVLLAMGFRRFKSAMPVASSCSLAIAAACHPVKGYEPDLIAQYPLRWGVVSGTTDTSGTSRCAFSSHHVEYPVNGVMFV